MSGRRTRVLADRWGLGASVQDDGVVQFNALFDIH